MRITVIAYRPDGVDTCRGCVMNTWGSEFDLNEFDDFDSAAIDIASRKHDDKYKKAYTASDWQITVLINGKVALSDDFGRGSALTEGEEDALKTLEGLIVHSGNVMEKNHQEALARKQRLAEEEKIREEAVAKERRRVQFENLKKEFEP
jgi:hypothetical protein